MAKSYDQIRAEMNAKGWQGEPTVEALKQFGWEPGDPLAGITIADTAKTPAQVRDELALLLAESKRQGVRPDLMAMITRVVGAVVPLL